MNRNNTVIDLLVLYHTEGEGGGPAGLPHAVFLHMLDGD